jgi:alpha-ribazole phosphatase
MLLAFIRHPAPAVAAGLCYGSSDLALQAGALEACLPQVQAQLLMQMPAQAPIFSSPLRRARELACALADLRGVAAPILDTRLQEMDFGRWEMRAWDHIERAEIDAWAADILHYAPGGAENVLQMTQRVLAFIQQRQQAAAIDNSAIIVCHAGVMRIAKAFHADLNAEQIALRAAQDTQKIGYGEVMFRELREK